MRGVQCWPAPICPASDASSLRRRKREYSSSSWQTHRRRVGEIVEAQAGAIPDVEGHLRTSLGPGSADAAQFVRLQIDRNIRQALRPNSHAGVRQSSVVDVDSNEDMRRLEAETEFRRG